LKTTEQLNAATSTLTTSVREVLCPSLTAHIGGFGSAAVTKRVSPRTMSSLQLNTKEFVFFFLFSFPWVIKNALAGQDHLPTGFRGAASVESRVRLTHARSARITSVDERPCPSLMAHIGGFGSTAVTKSVSPRDDVPFPDKITKEFIFQGLYFIQLVNKIALAGQDQPSERV